MEVYAATYLIFTVICFIELFYEKKIIHKNNISVLIYFIFVIQFGLRWEMGTDWLPYLINFENTDSLEVVLINVINGFELGYGILVLSVRYFTEQYSIFLILHALIFYGLVIKSIKLFSPLPMLSLLFFYVTNIGIVGSNRQLIAVALCMYSIRYIVNRNLLKFIGLVFGAVLFHTSAFIFFVFYFLNKDFNPKLVLTLLLSSLVVGFTSIPLLLFSWISNQFGVAASNKASWYIDKINLSDHELTSIGLIRRLCYLFIFYYNYKTLAKIFREYKIFFNAFIIGLMFYLLFSKDLLILVNRGSIYFNIAEIFLITSLMLLPKSVQQRLIFFIIFCFYSALQFYQSISVYPDLFLPYQNLFYNFNHKRYLY